MRSLNYKTLNELWNFVIGNSIENLKSVFFFLGNLDSTKTFIFCKNALQYIFNGTHHATYYGLNHKIWMQFRHESRLLFHPYSIHFFHTLWMSGIVARKVIQSLGLMDFYIIDSCNIMHYFFLKILLKLVGRIKQFFPCFSFYPKIVNFHVYL